MSPKSKTLSIVYQCPECKSYWEVWNNFKSHMIDEHEYPADKFVDKKDQHAEA